MKGKVTIDEAGKDSHDLLTVDFVEASKPRSDLAKDLQVQFDTLAAAGNAGNLRIAGSVKGAIIAVNPYLVGIKPGWNLRDHTSRENIEHVLSLAASIAEFGVKTALTVYQADGKYWVTDGHCRYLAVMHAINNLGAQIVTIPIAIEEKGSNEADRIAGQLLLNSGKSFSPLEKARVCRKLEGFGWGVKRIGAALGMSPNYVRELLRLHATASIAIEKMINDNTVTASFAAKVIKGSGMDVEAAEAVLTEVASVARSQGKSRASGKHLRLVQCPAKSNAVMAPSAPTGIASTFVPDGQDEGMDLPGQYASYQSPHLQRLLRDLFLSATVTFSDGTVSAVFNDKASGIICRLLDLH